MTAQLLYSYFIYTEPQIPLKPLYFFTYAKDSCFLPWNLPLISTITCHRTTFNLDRIQVHVLLSVYKCSRFLKSLSWAGKGFQKKANDTAGWEERKGHRCWGKKQECRSKKKSWERARSSEEGTGALVPQPAMSFWNIFSRGNLLRIFRSISLYRKRELLPNS